MKTEERINLLLHQLSLKMENQKNMAVV